MLGGASAVGALLGVVVGRQFKRSKKIYVDVDSPLKHQQALMRAQQKQKGGASVGGALMATVTTLAFRVLNDKVLTPRLEGMAQNLLDRAGQDSGQKSAPKPAAPRPVGSSRSAPAPAGSSGTLSFLKRDGGAESGDTARTGVPGGQTAPGTGSSVPVPTSTVVAKAQGSPIDPQEKANPNIR
jgi:hypothetical protein